MIPVTQSVLAIGYARYVSDSLLCLLAQTDLEPDNCFHPSAPLVAIISASPLHLKIGYLTQAVTFSGRLQQVNLVK